MSGVNVPELEFVALRNFDEFPEGAVDESVSVYQNAFLNPPYNESFTADGARRALEYVFDMDGDLVLGTFGGKVVSLAGGYYKDDGLYYIEELAVEPLHQGKGFGKMTLRSLIEVAEATQPASYGIRTNAGNHRAIALYQHQGFQLEPVQEVVPQTRSNDRIALDTRVHLTKENLPRNEMKTELKRLVVVYPSGNTTAVVFDQLLDADREKLNSQIMETWKRENSDQPEIEQCCFVTTPEDPDCIGKVEMFGGEFCGNATRSVIQLLTGGKDYEGKIESSGVDFPLSFVVKDGIISVEMPLPKNEADNVFAVDEGTLVRLDGIVHIVVNDTKKQQERTARETLTDLLEENKYDLQAEPAVGVCYFDEATEKADFAVWVRDVRTIFDETACGSGTSCIGVAMSFLRKSDGGINVIQPSGKGIVTKARYDVASGKVVSSQISGTVDYLFDGRYKI